MTRREATEHAKRLAKVARREGEPLATVDVGGHRFRAELLPGEKLHERHEAALEARGGFMR